MNAPLTDPPATSVEPSGVGAGWRFDNTYARLPSELFEPRHPTPVAAPALVVFNKALALRLGLRAEALSGEAGVAIFSGNALPEGALPIAQAYAGHQFGHFTRLGDGRAILLGEHLAPDGQRWDIQLKGAGPTAFSRGGDGRAALGPMLREYIMSEGMHALGIPTTRSLAVVTTGEPVYREHVLQGAVLTRIAASHVRVGTFELVGARRNTELLRALADYCIARHDPTARSAAHPYLAWLTAVSERQAELIAKWMLVGFVHGVMNTDNMAIAGETIDYGPCAFIDAYDPMTVFSSIDHHGRYAFGNQPNIAKWNLVRLLEAMLPLLHDEEKEAIALAEGVLRGHTAVFERAYLEGLRRKLGLFNAEEGDQALASSLLAWMREDGADYTQTLRALASGTLPQQPSFGRADVATWHAAWSARLSRQPEPLPEAQRLMRAHNPAVIPRNHRVEEALRAATERGDFSVLEQLLSALARPYEDLPEHAQYGAPPEVAEPYRTFCGT